MHKILVHAQDFCACTRILCMHKNIFSQLFPLRCFDPGSIQGGPGGSQEHPKPSQQIVFQYIEKQILGIGIAYYCLLLLLDCYWTAIGSYWIRFLPREWGTNKRKRLNRAGLRNRSALVENWTRSCSPESTVQ